VSLSRVIDLPILTLVTILPDLTKLPGVQPEAGKTLRLLTILRRFARVLSGIYLSDHTVT